MNKYWTTTSTGYISNWQTNSTYGKVSITYTLKK